MSDTKSQDGYFVVTMAAFKRPISMSRVDSPQTEMFSAGSNKPKVADMIYTPYGLEITQGPNSIVVPLSNILYARK
jgi:hypothetical protein